MLNAIYTSMVESKRERFDKYDETVVYPEKKLSGSVGEGENIGWGRGRFVAGFTSGFPSATSLRLRDLGCFFSLRHSMIDFGVFLVQFCRQRLGFSKFEQLGSFACAAVYF